MTQLPLSALLSKTLVAFTIEFDNEFEHQFPHITSRGPAANSGDGPWLVSMAMWSNFIRWLDPDVASSVPIERLGPLVNLPGLRRWGYVNVDSDARIEPTQAGRRARPLWSSVADDIDSRWRSRFGDPTIDELHQSLSALVDQLDPELPWHLPVSGVRRHEHAALVGPRPSTAVPLDLAALLARALVTFRGDFEAQSRLSLPLSANTLRVLGASTVAVRGLPALTGTSRESVSLSLGLLCRHDLAVLGRDGSAKVAHLTERGQRAQAKAGRILAGVEAAWAVRFGFSAIEDLRAALERVVTSSRLGEGLEPDPDGWRAHPPYVSLTRSMLADPMAGLPEYPMVSHRGGFPDGS